MSRAAIVTSTLRYRCIGCGEKLEQHEHGTMRVTQGNRDIGPVCSRNACQVKIAKRLADRLAEEAAT